jgi:hypothetical protein
MNTLSSRRSDHRQSACASDRNGGLQADHGFLVYEPQPVIPRTIRMSARDLARFGQLFLRTECGTADD